jgi:nucleotide-binding universal stress UspA family protein
MYTDVVVGIDGTDAGRDALALAQTLASGSSHLALAHVRELGAAALQGDHGSSFTAPTREESIGLLSAERERAATTSEILSVLAPDIGSGLHDVAESRGTELLVIGSCRRAAIGWVLVGDDTRAVLDRAPCSVAVAPRGYRTRVNTVNVIGVAYDDAAHSNMALACAGRLSAVTGARVIAQNVIQRNLHRVGAGALPAVADDNEEIASARETIGYLGDAEVTVAVGTSGETLAAFSETVDVLICGSRNNQIVRRVALGSTTDYLSRHCACPLIITTAPALGPRERFEQRFPPRQGPNPCTASRSLVGSAEKSARGLEPTPGRAHG